MSRSTVIVFILIACLIGINLAVSLSVLRLDSELREMDSRHDATRRNVEHIERSLEVLGYEVIQHQFTILACQRFLDIGVVPVVEIARRK